MPLGLLLFTVFYQSLHSSGPVSHVRHPGELLWDLVVTITPARFLYALDHWLHPPVFPVPDSMLPAQSTSYAAKSETLRRILSMDSPKSLMNAVAHAGKSISSLSNFKPGRATDQPAGLGNFDNSCFQNSILQGLSSLKPLPAYLASAWDDTKGLNDQYSNSSAATLRDLLSRLGDSQNNGTTLWTPKKLKSLDTWQQQDAQEYYSKILDEIDKEVTKVALAQYRPLGLEAAGVRDDTVESQHSDDSGYQSLSTLNKSGSETRVTKNPLEGLVAQRVACVQCGHSEGLSMIPFNCITLNLGVGQGVHDLYERLDAYTALEWIEGVECAKCTLLKNQRLLNLLVARARAAGAEEGLQEILIRLEAVEQALEEDDFDEQTIHDECKIPKRQRVSSTKTKQMVIGRPPSSLAIHINRSVFDENTGQMFKNLAAVRFPRTLDLGPWCLGSAGSTGSVQDAEEQWSSGPKSSMISGDLHPSKISGPIYELRAVVTHQGRHENGHYVCYRRHPCQVLEAEGGSKRAHESQTDEQCGHDSMGEPDPELDSTDKDSKWWRLSDETVWEVTEESVLAQGGVFMLFYDCVDQNSILVSEKRESDAMDYDDDSTGASRVHGTNQRTDAEVESCDARPDFRVLDSSDGMVLSTDHSPSAKQTVVSSPRGRLGEYAALHLYPPLGEDEAVDPMIPLRWPNS